MGLARLEEEEENQGEDDDKLLFAATTRFVCGHDLLLGQCHLHAVFYPITKLVIRSTDLFKNM